MLRKLLVAFVALAIGTAMSGCLRVKTENGKTTVRPGTIEVERHDVRDAPQTAPADKP